MILLVSAIFLFTVATALSAQTPPPEETAPQKNDDLAPIAQRLIKGGAKVKAHDPIALENARRYYGDLGIHYFDNAVDAARDADAIVLVTDWIDYRKLDWGEIRNIVQLPLVLDGRNFLSEDQLEQLGFTIVGVGRAGVTKHLFQV